MLGPLASLANGHFTVVPSGHVSNLTALAPEDMAAVLAGMAALSHTMKGMCNAESIEIVTSRRGPEGAGEHVRFHLVPYRSSDPEWETSVDPRAVISGSGME